MSECRPDLAEELLALLGLPDAAAAQVRKSLELDMLRQARISQGQAARMLGVTRWDLLDLMVQYGIPSGPESAEELRLDIEAARRGARPA